MGMSGVAHCSDDGFAGGRHVVIHHGSHRSFRYTLHPMEPVRDEYAEQAICACILMGNSLPAGQGCEVADFYLGKFNVYFMVYMAASAARERGGDFVQNLWEELRKIPRAEWKARGVSNLPAFVARLAYERTGRVRSCAKGRPGEWIRRLKEARRLREDIDEAFEKYSACKSEWLERVEELRRHGEYRA